MTLPQRLEILGLPLLTHNVAFIQKTPSVHKSGMRILCVVSLCLHADKLTD